MKKKPDKTSDQILKFFEANSQGLTVDHLIGLLDHMVPKRTLHIDSLN